jgi:hypothetical protein
MNQESEKKILQKIDEMQIITNSLSSQQDDIKLALARIDVSIKSIYSRLDLYDSTHKSGNTNNKRAINTVKQTETESVCSDTSKDKESKSKKNTNTEKEGESSKMNTLTFFKKVVMCNETLRNKYVTKEETDTAGSNINSKKKGLNSDEYWIAIGNILWKNFDSSKKDSIKKEFERYSKSNSSTEQLEEDNKD